MSNILKCNASNDELDVGLACVEFVRQRVRARSVDSSVRVFFPDFSHLCISQFGRTGILCLREFSSEGMNRMLHVFGLIAPLKVFQPVVRSLSVFVVALVSVANRRSEESKKHEAVDEKRLVLSCIPKIYDCISAIATGIIDVWLEHFPAMLANSANRGNFVKSLIAHDRTPFFCRINMRHVRSFQRMCLEPHGVESTVAACLLYPNN